MTIPQAFGSVLKAIRNAQGLSQEKLAFDANLDRTFISLLERGQRQPTLTTVFELCKALKCKASDVIAKVERLSRS